MSLTYMTAPTSTPYQERGDIPEAAAAAVASVNQSESSTYSDSAHTSVSGGVTDSSSVDELDDSFNKKTTTDAASPDQVETQPSETPVAVTMESVIVESPAPVSMPLGNECGSIHEKTQQTTPHDPSNGVNGFTVEAQVKTHYLEPVYSRDLPPLSKTVVRAPARYVESMPGKKIRDKAANALNIWLRVDEQDLNQIRNVINLLHNASLILDDVEDGSISRRGRPATHMVFGTPQAINSAGYQINKAMIEVMKLGDMECIKIFSEEMDKLYVGQGYDLFWTFNTERPSTEEYISMVDCKTGALFNMLARLMAAKTQVNWPTSPDLYPLVLLLGRYFQIRDDYMNLTSLEYTDQKGFCEDLDEGKFSLIFIHALEHAPEAERSILRHTLAQRHISNAMSFAQKHLVLSIMKSTGSLDYAVDALRKLGEEIDLQVDAIEKVTGIRNEPLRGLLSALKV